MRDISLLSNRQWEKMQALLREEIKFLRTTLEPSLIALRRSLWDKILIDDGQLIDVRIVPENDLLRLAREHSTLPYFFLRPCRTAAAIRLSPTPPKRPIPAQPVCCRLPVFAGSDEGAETDSSVGQA